MNNIPQIAIIYEEGHHQLKEVATAFVEDVTCRELDIRAESRPGIGVMACVEWYIPTALFLFFGKAYFDGFLKEMGKDHYGIAKKGISKLWSKLFSRDKVIELTLVGTPGKLTENYKYSLAFSIIGELNENKTIKFLFEESISEIEFSERIDLVMNFLNAIHTNPENIKEYFVLNDHAISSGSIVLVGYDPKCKKLINLDPREKHKPNLSL